MKTLFINQTDPDVFIQKKKTFVNKVKHFEKYTSKLISPHTRSGLVKINKNKRAQQINKQNKSRLLFFTLPG